MTPHNKCLLSVPVRPDGHTVRRRKCGGRAQEHTPDTPSAPPSCEQLELPAYIQIQTAEHVSLKLILFLTFYLSVFLFEVRKACDGCRRRSEREIKV